MARGDSPVSKTPCFPLLLKLTEFHVCFETFHSRLLSLWAALLLYHVRKIARFTQSRPLAPSFIRKNAPFHLFRVSCLQTRTVSPYHVPFRCITTEKTPFSSFHVGKRGDFHCIVFVNTALRRTTAFFAVSSP